MAKRRGRGDERLDHAAQQIGTLLGHVAARVDSWKKQRESIAADVRQVVATGQRLLRELGSDAQSAAATVTRGRPGRKKGFKMSEATKAKLRAAWRRRKAAKAKAQS